MRRYGSDRIGNKGRLSSRIVLVVASAFLIGLFSLIDVVIWFSDEGGILSVLSAAQSARAKTPSIDIDSDGLRYPAIVGICLLMFGLFWVLKLDLRGTWLQIPWILIVVGGGFLVGGIASEKWIAGYMTTHGYQRCSAQDHFVTRGRGRGGGQVWFHNYILAAMNCPASPAAS